MTMYLFIVDILPVNSNEETVSHYFFSIIWSSTEPEGQTDSDFKAHFHLTDDDRYITCVFLLKPTVC